MDKRKNNKGTIGNKGGRPSKAEEFNLHDNMEKLMPTKTVLNKFSAIIKDTTDEKLKFAAIVKWLEWRVGKPKESINLNQSGKLEIESPILKFVSGDKDKR